MLTTRRLQLAEVSPGLAEQLAAGIRAAGQHWAAGYPLDGTVVAASMQLLAAAAAGAHVAGFGMYQIIDRASGQVVGDMGFHGPPGEARAVEVGYGIVPARRGEGLASESLRALAAWALAQPGVDRVVARTGARHRSSQRVLLRSASAASAPLTAAALALPEMALALTGTAAQLTGTASGIISWPRPGIAISAVRILADLTICRTLMR